DFWPSRDAINVEYNESDVVSVPGPDGSVVKLRKTHPEYDPTDRVKALEYVAHHAAKGEVVTGLLYLDPNPEDLHAHLNTVETPFNKLSEKELCPGAGMLEKINASLR
ncbi:MAG TPA: 2-oxoacid:ferredoxin oxidoreductase subunit beta, partial [Burkholderiales bacterium]|nr:2-oxoacid:ferredoxin oxidoreductase subunit beta [Burkholderiales bacterium]